MLAIFSKHSILDVWQGSEYTYDLYMIIFDLADKCLLKIKFETVHWCTKCDKVSPVSWGNVVRGAFKTVSKILDEAALQKQVTTKKKL